MNKTITSLIIGLTLSATSSFSFAENLETVYQQALTNDPTVLKAKAEYMASKEGIDQARAMLLPHIGANFKYSKSKNESTNYNSSFASLAPVGSILNNTTDNASYGASLSMELYHHDSWLKMSNAEKAAHFKDLAYQIAKQQLIVRVTQAYFAVLSANDDLTFTRAEKAAIERQLEQTKQRFSVGLTAITDVHEAQAKFDNATTNVIKAENTVSMREEELRAITNVYPDKLSVLDTSSFSTTTPMPNSANEWQHIAEDKSLDIIAEKVITDISKENINIARAGHYPSIDLNGSWGRSKDKFSLSAMNGSLDFPSTPYYDSKSIGITLTVPIYSGGATSSLVRQAQQNYVAASQDLETTHRTVVRNVRNAFNSVNASISSIKALKQSVISAESALKATEAGFEVGTRTIVDVLNSTQNVYNAKRNLSSTRYGYIEAVLALKRAGGNISEQDIADISKGLTAKSK